MPLFQEPCGKFQKNSFPDWLSGESRPILTEFLRKNHIDRRTRKAIPTCQHITIPTALRPAREIQDAWYQKNRAGFIRPGKNRQKGSSFPSNVPKRISIPFLKSIFATAFFARMGYSPNTVPSLLTTTLPSSCPSSTGASTSSAS